MVDKQIRAKYTLEFKQEAVRQARTSGVTAAARALNVPKGSLTNWMRLDSKDELMDSLQQPKVRMPTVTPEQMEITRLRAEVAQLRMERDIAKKAAAYFAQDTLRGTPGLIK